jgi:hypothetical protein
MPALVIILVMSQLSGTAKPHSCVQRCLETLINGGSWVWLRRSEHNGLVISNNADQVAKSSTWIMPVHIIPSIKINGATFP